MERSSTAWPASDVFWRSDRTRHGRIRRHDLFVTPCWRDKALELTEHAADDAGIESNQEMQGFDVIGLIEAVVDVHTSNVISEQPVRVKMQQGTINANRMEVIDSGDVIRFGGGVTMTMKSGGQAMHLDGRMGVP